MKYQLFQSPHFYPPSFYLKHAITLTDLQHYDSQSSRILTTISILKNLSTNSFSDEHRYDILLVPGGIGTRKEVTNQDLLGWIRERAEVAEFVTSVCTGNALLARAGILDGIRATTNKMAIEWVTSQGPKVIWEKEARWIEDAKFFTSSGVSAGMDMALGLISKILGRDSANQVAIRTEYDWHEDPSWDPFAKIHGLV